MVAQARSRYLVASLSCHLQSQDSFFSVFRSMEGCHHPNGATAASVPCLRVGPSLASATHSHVRFPRSSIK
ncbi:hypothetical protein B0H19DRAFT_1141259 [Mycena capillaripes]|nr:hypothetical protein B0H19DRAFT_1141259 [Mycena capillaripes]